ncbi:MAG: poly-gamma-glutamate system protein [Desulfobacter sp.]|nr:poly-gamma-glutamate system protein [Desulfobacter sp.]
MEKGIKELKAMRQSMSIPLEPKLDPALSGLIGVDYSDITSTLGDLRAKQTSLNPQFAGLLVVWLKQAGIKKRDRVALSFSGSFPALNLATHCACDVLNLNTFIISSVGASCYGANIPGFTWLDMESRLFDKGLIRTRSCYASLGGIMDTGGGIDETGIEAGEAAIMRHGARYLREGTPRTVVFDVKRRMDLYTTGGLPKAFINVGGNVMSMGWVSEAALLDNGLIKRIPDSSSPQRGTIFRMFEAGVPVIHLINIERLAAAYHLPIAPVNLTPGADLGMDMDTGWRGHLWQLGILLAAWFFIGSLFLFYELSLCRKKAE